ncbi:hypothetical protein DACRYDRAFT_56235 [Dacryopinax primogenitus]|uniref:Nitrogen permease regulator 3 n=1 Tax=Dacryopinax primogenitus (strain DJM 731) TaxID=1858805 RepID=M5G6S2_DACPD|nr:uncharacterized protein DACRYDRAFT_56235 [Dacryopinax primogenitus]EJT99457.1 hypothetical protein DACRYDRAFT_56235 [Dacryopinax primogenitus]
MSSPAPPTPPIALLLVTTSSTLGTSIIFRYPPYPSSSARLMRPLPYRQGARHGLDGMYQASHLPSDEEEEEAEEEQSLPSLSQAVYEAQTDYDTVLSFSPATLTEILKPARELCCQKFELVVDDLAFVVHLVCVARDGVWRMDNIAPPSSPRKRSILGRQSRWINVKL